MESFVAVVHILVALVLIALVLLQDTKSGSVGGAFGGGGSNSVLGATGATTLAQTMTRWVAFAFAITCLLLSYHSTKTSSSVFDGAGAPAAAPITPASSPEAAPGSDAPVPPAEGAPANTPATPDAGK